MALPCAIALLVTGQHFMAGRRTRRIDGTAHLRTDVAFQRLASRPGRVGAGEAAIVGIDRLYQMIGQIRGFGPIAREAIGRAASAAELAGVGAVFRHGNAKVRRKQKREVLPRVLS